MSDKTVPCESGNAVLTRAEVRKKNKHMAPLNVTDIGRGLGVDDFRREQKNDPTLTKLFEKARLGKKECVRGRYHERYEIHKGLLYRRFFLKGRDPVKQLVVPKKFRLKVISVAHESILAGHLRIRKTIDRVGSCFNWPGMSGEITRFCQSCDLCQRTIPKGRVTKVPLQSIPVVSEPFDKIGVDIVGPIYPPTDDGNRYMLTLMCYSIRYPEAIALPEIDTPRVAEALFSIFSRLGFPSEIITDQGPQFISDVMKEINRLLSIKGLKASPYHPMTNGMLEHFHLTLKQMLMKLCGEEPKQWDR